MNIENKFNLIDEPWVPIVDVGRVSLRQLFSCFDYRALGGNPLQKIALTKLLLAIAQAAYTPDDDDDWEKLGIQGLSVKCLAYLESMYDRFWLYGEKPFLQTPKISSAELKNFGLVQLVTENTTILNEAQIERPLSDADKALLIIFLMGCARGGGITDNKIVLSEGYQGKLSKKGKKSKGSPGPFLCSNGLMHSFLLSDSLIKTIYINLFTKEDVKERLSFYSNGVGIAPWEKMPEGEDCPTANALKNSLMGRLVPVSRFCLLTDDKLHYSEGIKYQNYNEGGIDPSAAIDSSKARALWVDPEKRPWRHLSALLNLSREDRFGFVCYQIKLCLGRARRLSRNSLGLWSGGVKISSHSSGEQYVSGRDDFVDSSILLPIEFFSSSWYEQLKSEMKSLDDLSSDLHKSTVNFFKTEEMKGKKTAKQEKGEKMAKTACTVFWQLCERKLQGLLIACNNPENIKSIRNYFFMNCANKAFDLFCPKETARQLDAWAKNRPSPKKYLTEKNKDSHD